MTGEPKAGAASGGGDANAAPLTGNPRPRYPLAARERGQEGRVVLRASVLTDGVVTQVEVKTSSGHPLLDQSAVEAVRRWRFQPARRAGQAVTATVDVPVVFRLESG